MSGFSIYRKSRSVRLRVTTPDGGLVSADNLRADQGFRIGFSCIRSMDDEPGSAQVTALNLPPDALGVLEAAQATRVDDLDAILYSQTLQSAAVDPDGADALAAGLLIVEVEAGYDGNTSRVFKVIGARASTSDDYGAHGEGQRRGRDGRFRRGLTGVTQKTTIDGNECLDGSLLGLPTATFPAGATLFEVVDYLRRLAGLGPGNCDYGTFTLIAGDARLDSPYHVSGGRALPCSRKCSSTTSPCAGSSMTGRCGSVRAMGCRTPTARPRGSRTASPRSPRPSSGGQRGWTAASWR